MILCVTPNPAIDRTLVVPEIRRGQVLRTTQVISVAGGKGFNVARVVRALGSEVRCAGFLGGHSGRLVAELAEHEGLEGVWSWIDGETRICTILLDQQGREPLTVYEVGPLVTGDDWARLAHEIQREAVRAKQICFSGSLPQGSNPQTFSSLLVELQGAGRSVWVDTSGTALKAALEAGPIGLKVNGAEAGELLSQVLDQPADAARAARALHARTGGVIVLTLGARGAVMASATGCWYAEPPKVKSVSAVGSGDAFLAGLVVAQDNGLAPAEALCHAVAAGTANALSVGGGQINPNTFQEIIGQISVVTMN